MLEDWAIVFEDQDLKSYATGGWLACLTAMWEDSRSNPASYLCLNTHVVKGQAAMLTIKRSAGVALDVKSQGMYSMYASSKCKQERIQSNANHPLADSMGYIKFGEM